MDPSSILSILRLRMPVSWLTPLSSYLIKALNSSSPGRLGRYATLAFTITAATATAAGVVLGSAGMHSPLLIASPHAHGKAVGGHRRGPLKVLSSTTHNLFALFSPYFRSSIRFPHLRPHVHPPHLPSSLLHLLRWASQFRTRLLTPLYRFIYPSPYLTYPSPNAEAKYWRQSTRYQRQLRYSDARWVESHRTRPIRAQDDQVNWENRLKRKGIEMVVADENSRGVYRVGYGDIPVVSSYSPALLPEYRQYGKSRREERDSARWEELVDGEVFLKWHRMVYPDKLISLTEAERALAKFSARDKREIYRMSQMLPDRVISSQRFKKKKVKRYQGMWDEWVNERRGLDLVIVFEDDDCRGRVS
ncbi:hypothetical protein BDN72DRAFT_141564 [Pluteus cervinus]|uniref:Uncharacterized protein n=1 Tax=Pluteus cervinus TaxID=181527 RepID=A0ACD3AML6_9AGAR|nr:hypothetical protein BDN72DRAFT_141564 [Pluteus cervinus]